MKPNLRFREFSGEWEEKKLEDITKINQGLQIAISERLTSKEPGTYFYITNEFLKPGNKKQYFIKNPPNSVIAEKNDLLMTRTGNTGVVVTGVEGAFHNNFFKIKLKKDNVSKQFLYYFLTSRPIQNLILGLAGTSTIPDLNHKDFYRIPIKLPTASEQEKIASFLGVVDEKIGQLQKKMELLVKYKKGVMQKIFSQQARFKDENGKNYPDWEEKKLEEAGKTYNGLQGKTAVDFGSGSNFITYKQIFDNSKIDISKFGKVLVGAKERQNQAEKGDAFFTTSSETPLEVGFASVLLDNVENVYLNSFCFGFRPNDQLLPEFARFLFRSSGFRKLMVRLAQGSTRYNISKLGFLKTPVLLPSKEEQQKIAKFLTALDDKIKLGESKLEQAKQFKKALLQQMFV